MATKTTSPSASDAEQKSSNTLLIQVLHPERVNTSLNLESRRTDHECLAISHLKFKR